MLNSDVTVKMNDFNDNAENCWEYWNCPKDVRFICDAYKLNFGTKCYLVAPNICPRRKTEYEYCWKCPWCKKVAPVFCQRANEDAVEKPKPGEDDTSTGTKEDDTTTGC